MTQTKRPPENPGRFNPPFKSDANYNLLYKNMTGKPVPEQAEAFFDTWDLDATKLEIARTMPVLMREHGVDDHYVAFWSIWMQALRNTQPELLAYLIYMVQRLLYMKSILRPTGSIYLHCDPTASHYLKVMMDGIFGHRNFRNEIIWRRTHSHGDTKRKFGAVTDTILYYTVSDKYIFNPQYRPFKADYIDDTFKKDASGRHWQSVTLRSPSLRPNLHYPYAASNGVTYHPHPNGWSCDIDRMRTYDAEKRLHYPSKSTGALRLKMFLDESSGVKVQSLWDDIDAIPAKSQERLGYPTQKPKELLKRIVAASTNEGQVVFDPFCGCGTAIYAAHELHREWIGCDIAILAVKLIREVLQERYALAEGAHFALDGIPVSVEQADELFKVDPFQFQHWVVERVGGFPMQKKVADRGIDGRVYFETRNTLEEMIISVKGGKLRPTDIRDLRGTMEREKAAMAGFLSLQEPSKAMRAEAADAGVYTYNDVGYPRLQLLTVRDILEGKREFHMPTRVNTKISTGQQSLAL
ncbi:DNA methyltransferase [Mesorhizobium sp. M1329]|uniref:DNA methyltransferase n=1 Tax=Mesorhizobium sp. M1329 TaxID=2957083 RepID=UPI003335835B